MDPRRALKAIVFGSTSVKVQQVWQVPIDFVLNALRREVEDYRLSSYLTFDIHVDVYPAPNAVSRYGLNGVWVGYSAYDFVQWAGLSTTHNVLVSSNGRPLVRLDGHWRSVSCWLETLKPPLNQFERKNAQFEQMHAQWAEAMKQERWAHQFRWWLANGKHFPVFKLPAEIREIIYGYVFSEWIEPYPRASVRRIDKSSRTALAKKMNFKLLLTCKQVKHEASNVLFSSTPFYVGHASILRDVTNDPNLQSRLRQLTIGFTHEQHLTLFRTSSVSETGQVETKTLRSAEAFKYMALDRLRLTFNRPSDTGACQVKFVEYIMEIAWPFVRGQMVSLKGCVKLRQIEAYKARCKAFRKGFEMWKEYRRVDGKSEGELVDYLQEVDDDEDDIGNGGGGVLLDETLREEGKAAPTSALAQGGMQPDLTCECKVRCNSKRWNFYD